jgi:DHA2 family multidrug resistance protein
MLESHGSGAFAASQQAHGLVANLLNQQATMLAYIDNFWMLGILVAFMIPLVFLMKKVKPGGPMAVH